MLAGAARPPVTPLRMWTSDDKFFEASLGRNPAPAANAPARLGQRWTGLPREPTPAPWRSAARRAGWRAQRPAAAGVKFRVRRERRRPGHGVVLAGVAGW